MEKEGVLLGGRLFTTGRCVGGFFGFLIPYIFFSWSCVDNVSGYVGSMGPSYVVNVMTAMCMTQAI